MPTIRVEMFEGRTPEQKKALAAALTEAMLRQGVVIRPLRAFGLPHCVRVSMGTDEGNRICAEAMAKAWASVKNAVPVSG